MKVDGIHDERFGSSCGPYNGIQCFGDRGSSLFNLTVMIITKSMSNEVSSTSWGLVSVRGLVQGKPFYERNFLATTSTISDQSNTLTLSNLSMNWHPNLTVI